MGTRARPSTTEIAVGDIVVNMSAKGPRTGRVIGFGLDPTRWVRVKMKSGAIRIWARDRVFVWTIERSRESVVAAVGE